MNRKFNCLSLIVLFLLPLVFVGCCDNPGGPAQAQGILTQVAKTYYNESGYLKPHIKEMGRVDGYVALGATIADEALALAGALTGQVCPSPEAVAAAQAKANEAQELAKKTGI
ncbi:MAG: hypothetical protein C4567_05155 [Deltaproteobacteria bacterium]|nr:MAG: hypothetical protein C4567_05155 [Deltaproteobacteria bacterium]